MINLSSVPQLFLVCSAIIFLYQCVLFAIASYKKNNGIADIGWGIGFIVIAVFAVVVYIGSSIFDYTLGQKAIRPDMVFLLIVSLVLIWGLRLSIYLMVRNWGKQEDWRYAKWRQEWGDSIYIRSFFQVFVLQGFFMIVIGSPIILAAVDRINTSLNMLQFIVVMFGLLLWLIGFFFQAVGDYQLFVFKKDPANKGRIMRYGVWQYTRHPNYFGEATMWWGIFLLSCVSADTLVGVLLRMIGPATITFMLLRVSGVTMLENKYKGNEEYENYQKNTSSFISMPNKKGTNG